MLNPTLKKAVTLVVQILVAALIAAVLLMLDIVRVRPAY
jgi:hypothetical protein